MIPCRILPTLLLLCFAPLYVAPGVAPPTYAGSSHNNFPPLSATNPTTNTSSPNCTDLSDGTGATYPSCWDTLGMMHWMFTWNATANGCHREEMWSTCFLRLAYGSAEYDCSRVGSFNCTLPQLGGPVTDPRVFYGAYNIYAVNSYFSTWYTALYAFQSQQAISQLALALSSASPSYRLTTSSLLSAIITHYGLDTAADSAFIDLLPSGPKAPLLATNVTYYSTQLGDFLADRLKFVMGEKGKGEFLWLCREGNMMAYTGESLGRLEQNLGGTLSGGGGQASTEGDVEEVKVGG